MIECPYCGSSKFEVFNKADYINVIVKACGCKECKKEFTVEYEVSNITKDEVKFIDIFMRI